MDRSDNENRWHDRQEKCEKSDRDARSDFDIDNARIVHSSSFRRLQGKTQILNLGESDFYRTRLTHTLEVAQICAGITVQLQKDYSSARYLPDRSLIQAIGFAHDLGHPPFGHAGEVALNYCMRDHGGFEGNGQTLRILSKLEHFSAKFGAALTRRTLLGILKYPCKYSTVRGVAPSLIVNSTTRFINTQDSKPPKCYLDCDEDVVNWILAPLCDADRQLFQRYTEFQPTKEKPKGHHKPKYKSLDCSIMELADDIAYCVHDFEDAIAMKLISKEKFRDLFDKNVCCDFLDYVKKLDSCSSDVYDYFVNKLFGNSTERKHFISRLVGHFIMAITLEKKF